MQKWNGQLLRKFDDTTEGNASVGTAVVVRNKSDNTITPLYEIDDTNSIQKNNPFVTDDFGRYSFFAPNGSYIVEFGDGSDSIEIKLFDTNIGEATAIVNPSNDNIIDPTNYLQVDVEGITYKLALIL